MGFTYLQEGIVLIARGIRMGVIRWYPSLEVYLANILRIERFPVEDPLLVVEEKTVV